MGLKAGWIRLFFIFCQIFAIFDDFSKCIKTLKNHEIWQKNEEKPCLICSQPISLLIPGTYPKMRFRVPVLPLILDSTIDDDTLQNCAIFYELSGLLSKSNYFLLHKYKVFMFHYYIFFSMTGSCFYTKIVVSVKFFKCHNNLLAK